MKVTVDLIHYAIIGNPTIFDWGYCGGLAKTDDAIKIPAGTGRETELSIMHVNASRPNVFDTDEFNCFVTATVKYFAVTYKTSTDGSIILKFAPSEDKWSNVAPAGWKAEDCFEVALPASGSDYTTTIVALSSAVQYTDPLFLFCFEAGDVTSDILIRNMGFFASEEEARTYYNLPAPSQGNGGSGESGNGNNNGGNAGNGNQNANTSDALIGVIAFGVVAMAGGVVLTKRKARR